LCVGWREGQEPCRQQLEQADGSGLGHAWLRSADSG
jgi:hypothetical protein